MITLIVQAISLSWSLTMHRNMFTISTFYSHVCVSIEKPGEIWCRTSLHWQVQHTCAYFCAKSLKYMSFNHYCGLLHKAGMQWSYSALERAETGERGKGRCERDLISRLSHSLQSCLSTWPQDQTCLQTHHYHSLPCRSPTAHPSCTQSELLRADSKSHNQEVSLLKVVH